MNMETEKSVATVTIPIDEYFELRIKAEQSLYLANELGRMERRFEELEQKIFYLEDKIRTWKQ